ncbi:N-acetylglutamate synthase-like GNAT family acetyltransferase [Clostridium algifaecis]|uniref:N-acetylglutamate synthase-like GNAT family acetyltransferase n=1 Tax=Clostridium algifaecis TaxID=1472040 RepID=A0ABS4KXQ0_9CLOT|nr:GNAT family N-acetyltransferase [Clostridium algifaecis]MBP2033669.1 N-acetylglutamate synthase-like GNAT family acetyltransferase [Clostridium algifaecis]
MEIIEGEYIITDDITKIKLDAVCNLLRQSHWAKDRPKEIIERTIKNSLCFGIFRKDVQVGFARVVSDYAVYSLISDVIIDERYRDKGLGEKLIEIIVNYPSIKSTSKVLWTTYAQKFYEKCGFKEESQYKFRFNRPY